jgi:hypothetical protein
MASNTNEEAKMAKISKSAIAEIEQALRNYETVCDENLSTPNSRKTYYDYASRFVRWLKDDFTPGEKLNYR